MPFVGLDFSLEAHVFRQFFGNINFKTDKFAGLRLHCPRSEFGDANTNGSALENVVEDIGAGRAGENEKRQRR